MLAMVYPRTQVHAIRLVGILLIVYAKYELKSYITDVEAECTATGVMGVMVSNN